MISKLENLIKAGQQEIPQRFPLCKALRNDQRTSFMDEGGGGRHKRSQQLVTTPRVGKPNYLFHPNPQTNQEKLQSQTRSSSSHSPRACPITRKECRQQTQVTPPNDRRSTQTLFSPYGYSTILPEELIHNRSERQRGSTTAQQKSRLSRDSSRVHLPGTWAELLPLGIAARGQRPCSR